MGRLRIFAIVGALALVAVACSKNTTTPSSGGTTPQSQSPSPSTSATTEPITKKGTKDVTSNGTFTLEADNDGTTAYYFDPTFLKAKAGEKITVKLENKGNVQHNFTISKLNVNQDLAIGKTVTISFTLPAGGADLEFHCEYHHASGMRGYFFFGSSPPAASGSSQGGTTTY